MKKASNIRTWNYPSKGTPIYRDTTEIPPMNSFRAGGYMGEDPPVKDYSTIPGVNKEKLAQWNSLGKEAPTNVQEAQLLAEAVGYNPQQAVIVAAQWALESGQGKKTGGDYNYFGIKSHNQSVRDRMKNAYGIETSAAEEVATSEYEGGKKKSTKASFLNFQNPIEAFLGHKAFLETNARYKKALEKTSPAEFVEALGEAGYATDVNYKNKIASIAKPIIGEEAFGTFSTTSSKELDKYKPKYFTNNSIPVASDPEEIKKIIEKTNREVSGASTYQPEQFVELESKKNIPIMSLTPGKPAFGQSIFTAGQTFNPPKMATQSNKKAYGGAINLFQNGGGDPPPNFFNFDPIPEYVGYQGRVPVAESTTVANTYRPTQQEIKATKEYAQKVGDLAQDIKKESNVSQKVAMQQAEQILEANSRIQPEAKPYANTKQAQERDAYVFDEGMNARDYFRYPLQFLAGRTPTEEERIQDRIRITDPRTSNLDKFMGTAGQAMSLAPEALINTGVGLALAPSRFSKLGQVVDAVSPVGSIKMPSSITKSVNNFKSNFSSALKGTSNTLSQIIGELKQGKLNKKSIAEGNKWLQEWINSPYTQQKIYDDVNAARNIVNLYKDPEHRARAKELLDLIEYQSRTFTPNSKEYSLVKQFKDNLEQYTKILGFNKSKTIDPIHSGNWGVSYQHGYHPNFRQAILDNTISAPDRYGSWISRTTSLSPKKRIGTTIHEGTHDWVSARAFTIPHSGMRGLSLRNTDPKIKEDFYKWEKLRTEGKDPGKVMGQNKAYQAYLADPTEMHARIMELRKDLNLSPEIVIDDNHADQIIQYLKRLPKNEQPIDVEGFLNVLGNDQKEQPKRLAELFNKFWVAAPAAIATTGAAASSNEYKQGGKLNSFNYQQNMLPLQTITEPQEVELTPEEIKYYRSLGYDVEELD